MIMQAEYVRCFSNVVISTRELCFFIVWMLAYVIFVLFNITTVLSIGNQQMKISQTKIQIRKE